LKNPHHLFGEDFLFGSYAALITELRDQWINPKTWDQDQNLWSIKNYA
jgi:hypothetical protein